MSLEGRVLRNRAQCAICADILESFTVHDFRTCKCGAISIDGGHEYLKRCFNRRLDLIELSETEGPCEPESAA